MNVSTATTAELVAFYNAHANKPVTKFSDRKTAERRVSELIAGIKFSPPSAERTAALAAADARELRCPKCGDTQNLTRGAVKILRGQQHVVNEHIADCHNCGHEWNTETGKPVRKAASNPDRSAAIAASWKNTSVAARRSVRHAVRVTDPRGGQGSYKSVREAFLVLALPLGQHIRFRGQLKAAGVAEFAGHKFAVVDK